MAALTRGTNVVARVSLMGSAVEPFELYWKPPHGHTAGAAACVSVKSLLRNLQKSSISEYFVVFLLAGGRYRGEGKVGVNRDELRETLAKRM